LNGKVIVVPLNGFPPKKLATTKREREWAERSEVKTDEAKTDLKVRK